MKINYIEVSIYKNSLLKSKLCQHFWQRFFSPMRWLSASGVMQRIGRGAQKFVDLCSGSSFQSIAPLLLLFSTSRTVVASSRTLLLHTAALPNNWSQWKAKWWFHDHCSFRHLSTDVQTSNNIWHQLPPQIYKSKFCYDSIFHKFLYYLMFIEITGEKFD